MSHAPALASTAKLEEVRRSDQRLHRRYPISLEIEYRLLNRGRVERLGFGRTLNISKGGALFECNDSLPVGSTVEIVLTWPFMLEGVCPLNLVLNGRVVRSNSRASAVQTRQHEFRTVGIRASRIPSSSSDERSLSPGPARRAAHRR
jgi:hypothetical protein